MYRAGTCPTRAPGPTSTASSPTAPAARTAAESIQALAAPSRLRILAGLHDGPAAVGEIAEGVGMEASAVSHQLRLLRHLGLVIGVRDGRRVVYELHDDHVGGAARAGRRARRARKTGLGL